MINLGTWETASSIIQVGLTWRDAIPIMAVGTLCVAIPVVLNGAIGAHLHAPFSVIVRSGFGYYFAYFAIASRCILAMFWLGIQSANGALAMQVMLMAIWPSFASYDWNGPNNTVSQTSIRTSLNKLLTFTVAQKRRHKYSRNDRLLPLLAYPTSPSPNPTNPPPLPLYHKTHRRTHNRLCNSWLHDPQSRRYWCNLLSARYRDRRN